MRIRPAEEDGLALGLEFCGFKRDFFIFIKANMAQTKDQKKEIVKDLAEKIKESKSVVFADFRGLKVKDLEILKKELREAGVSFKVTKKTLMNVALKEAKIEANVREMEGQIGVAVSALDEVAPAKIIEKFSKTNENIKLAGGILGKTVMSLDEVKALAKLPGKDELLAKLVGTINAPVSGLVNALAGNIRGLMQVLKGISEKQA
jgi:large subunit ribosomal protein L10